MGIFHANCRRGGVSRAGSWPLHFSEDLPWSRFTEGFWTHRGPTPRVVRHSCWAARKQWKLEESTFHQQLHLWPFLRLSGFTNIKLTNDQIIPSILSLPSLPTSIHSKLHRLFHPKKYNLGLPFFISNILWPALADVSVTMSPDDIAALLEREGSGVSQDQYDETLEDEDAREKRTALLSQVLSTCQELWDTKSTDLDLVAQKLGDGSRDGMSQTPPDGQLSGTSLES